MKPGSAGLSSALYQHCSKQRVEGVCIKRRTKDDWTVHSLYLVWPLTGGEAQPPVAYKNFGQLFEF